MRKAILLVIMMVLGIEAEAQKFTYKGPDGNTLYYNVLTPTTVEVTNKGCNKPYKYTEVFIPEQVAYKGQQYSVTSIGEYAFCNCSSMTSIAIPNSVTSIGKFAFQECSFLTSIAIPNSVTSIKEDAFYHCSSLTSIAIPNSVTFIGQSAFMGCSSLTSITIPNSVTSIGRYAFDDCSSLTNVKGLYSGIDIDELAFDGHPFYFNEYRKGFEYAANSYVIPKIKEWQKKRDFESTAQYQARVTAENQQKKVQELTNEAIRDYTAKNPITVTLGDYDADYGVYALNSNYGQKHVRVPLAEAPAFKEKFREATFDADYVATTDGLQISDLTINLNGKQYRAEQTAVELAQGSMIDLPAIDLPLSAAAQTATTQPTAPRSTAPKPAVDRSIDQDIPATGAKNEQTFAVIIGNERYSHVAAVPFAENDARVFAEYCRRTLGLPERNVKVYENATYGTMVGAVSDLQKIAKAFKGNLSIVFYYAGHGIPDEATGDAYLLPTDADGLNMRVCYPLSLLYRELGELQARNVTCFMDACFSGAQRGNGMVVAARGVAIKAKDGRPEGNTVVFTAATDKQTAFPYEEKGHGMFTYYLLKKLRETQGGCTLGELGEYVSDEVAKQAVVTNGKEQTPTVLTSADAANTWKSATLR